MRSARIRRPCSRAVQRLREQAAEVGNLKIVAGNESRDDRRRRARKSSSSSRRIRRSSMCRNTTRRKCIRRRLQRPRRRPPRRRPKFRHHDDRSGHRRAARVRRRRSRRQRLRTTTIRRLLPYPNWGHGGRLLRRGAVLSAQHVRLRAAVLRVPARAGYRPPANYPARYNNYNNIQRNNVNVNVNINSNNNYLNRFDKNQNRLRAISRSRRAGRQTQARRRRREAAAANAGAQRPRQCRGDDGSGSARGNQVPSRDRAGSMPAHHARRFARGRATAFRPVRRRAAAKLGCVRVAATCGTRSGLSAGDRETAGCDGVQLAERGGDVQRRRSVRRACDRAASQRGQIEHERRAAAIEPVESVRAQACGP